MEMKPCICLYLKRKKMHDLYAINKHDWLYSHTARITEGPPRRANY